MVDGDFMKVLHQECFRRADGRTLIVVHGPRGVLSGSLWAAAVDFGVLFDWNLLVRDLLTDQATDDRRDFWKVAQPDRKADRSYRRVRSGSGGSRQ